jgi:hypothetical protein
MKTGGAKNWYFADGYLPEKKGGGAMEAHEALMLFNTNTKEARVKIDFYFDDKPPVKNVAIVVPGERVICLRLDKPEQIRGVVIPPLAQYAIRIRSSANIVAQFGRLDTTQPNLAYYVGVGYSH